MSSSIKERKVNKELYQRLRREGASKQRAARIAGATAEPGGGALVGLHDRGSLDDLTVYELKLRAKELGRQGYSDKSRAQLLDMVKGQ